MTLEASHCSLTIVGMLHSLLKLQSRSMLTYQGTLDLELGEPLGW